MTDEQAPRPVPCDELRERAREEAARRPELSPEQRDDLAQVLRRHRAADDETYRAS